MNRLNLTTLQSEITDAEQLSPAIAELHTQLTNLPENFEVALLLDLRLSL
jgi:hypothetical protein